MAIAAYVLCTLTALACAALLTRGYQRSRFRLLLWSALCFWGFFLGNLMVIVDFLLLENVDLYLVRMTVWMVSIVLLLYGMIWETK